MSPPNCDKKIVEEEERVKKSEEVMLRVSTTHKKLKLRRNEGMPLFLLQEMLLVVERWHKNQTWMTHTRMEVLQEECQNQASVRMF